MPTYDYACSECGHRDELFEPMSATTKKKCPKCGKKQFSRQIGAGAGFLFKGSGFYTTDYRSDSYTAGEKADKPSTGACTGTPSNCDGPCSTKT